MAERCWAGYYSESAGAILFGFETEEYHVVAGFKQTCFEEPREAWGAVKGSTAEPRV